MPVNENRAGYTSPANVQLDRVDYFFLNFFLRISSRVGCPIS
jgi:hypothetical protein